MGKSAAVAFAYYGAGRPPALTSPARGIPEFKICFICTLVAFRLTGEFKAVAGAIPFRYPGERATPIPYPPTGGGG